MNYFLLTFSVILNTVANVTLKLHTVTGFRLEHSRNPRFFLDNYQFFLAIGLFGLNMIAYYIAIKNIPLSIAFPYMMAMSFLLISVFSKVFFRENITVFQLVGYSFILVGVFLVFFVGQKGSAQE